MPSRKRNNAADRTAAEALAAAHGYALASEWDHAAALGYINDNRRRLRGTAYGNKIDGTAEWLADSLIDVLDLSPETLRGIGEALLLISGQAAFGLVTGVFPDAPDDILNVLGFTAARLCDPEEGDDA